jgi:dihydrodipicolinate synthase/N-acetylneuraminate lyase
VVIPAHPLALDSRRRLDERRQRALTRYYLAAGAGGIAAGVHTTQFAIRNPAHDLLRPVLELAEEEARRHEEHTREPIIRVAGICGRTPQAIAEAELARELGCHAGLLSLSVFRDDPIQAMIDHARAVAAVVPIFGFYLQAAVGGRVLPYAFWRRLTEIENLVAIKIAPFNRYQTLDVLRAVVDSGRDREIALYTGNDDAILTDLMTPHTFVRDGEPVTVRIVGGLLGHWAVWTRRAAEQLEAIHRGWADAALAAREAGAADPAGCLPRDPSGWLTLAAQVTDANAAFFDAANGFAGCIAGLHEVLRRQGLMAGRWCLDPEEDLSPGQMEEIDRVYAAYPHLQDDAFVAAHRDAWLSG